jgi:hypothetical protein
MKTQETVPLASDNKSPHLPTIAVIIEEATAFALELKLLHEAPKHVE